ncbi:MAG TPA: pitrilysin family protein, partial [Methylomirabilota bacterium]|nr:pitrilysin family protein [Methylomirabilota bacterium]
MNRSRSRSILISALQLAAFAIPLSARELPSDDRLLHGQLDNGVRWIYRQHDNPPGKMALQMHVRTGSLNETDDQRGLAHFLEHMCFNGSENFPPGTLVPYFESIGMQFGPHLNAFTSFDQTVYMLFTPNTETEQLDKALMVLSDYAFRVTLPGEEIDKERGVVLEESRSGKGAQQRIRDELWPDLFADTRFAARLPIGEDDILANAPRSEFVDYYRAWYRPDNITVVLVGDADPEPILPLIEKWFGEYEAGQPARDPKGPEFKPFTGERAFVVTDPEMPYCEVELLNIYPGRPPTTTEAQWRNELVESIGAWIVGRRYDDRVKKGEASYRQAYAGVSDFFHDAVLVYGGASGEPQDWETMLTELITEVKRAREHGFTERELDLARRQLLAAAERAVRTEPTLNAQSIISQIVASVNDRTPLLSAQTSLNLFEEHLPGVTLDEVNRAFEEHFKPGTFAHIVTLVEKEGVPVPTRDEVLAGARKAWDREVDPLPDSDAAAELLEELPEPGKFVEQSRDEELGVTSAWLDNGVRMHHRFMDYKKDSVYVSISLAGGNIE